MKKLLLLAVVTALLLACAVPSGISAALTVTESSAWMAQPSPEKLKFKVEYEIDCSVVGEGLIVVQKDGLCGYADLDGNIVIPPKWFHAEPFENGVAVVMDDIYHPYLIGHNGRKIADLDCMDAQPCGSMLVTLNYNWDNLPSVLTYGLTAPDGTVIVPPQYDFLTDLTDTLFLIKSADSLYGVIDASGKEILPVEYDSVVYDITADLLCAEKDGKKGYLALDGTPVIPLGYDSVFFGKEDLAIAEKDGKCGGLDRNGNTVIPFEYEWLGARELGRSAYRENGLYGYLDENGATVIPPKYDTAKVFSEDGLARVRKGVLWGFIDREGNEVIPCAWTESAAFSHGLAFAGDGTKTVCFGTSGEILFELPPVRIVETSKNGLTVYYEIHTDEDGQRIWKYGLVDRAGNEILPPVYNNVSLMSNGWVTMRTGEFPDDVEGLVSPDGQLIFEPAYVIYPYFIDEYIILKGKDMWYIIDEEGNLVL